jgi:hypothetical protein
MLKQTLIILSIIATITGYAYGNVSTNVYISDSNIPLGVADINTPLVYKDIMVGTKLAIVIDSNAAELWSGGLYLMGGYRDFGILTGRDFNNITLDWQGSRFEAAGSEARVFPYDDDLLSGFDFYGDIYATAGLWYVIDYTALKEGSCSVGFYDYNIDWFTPVYNLMFNQVPTRDFNSDYIVNFQDFAVFAAKWQVTDSDETGGFSKVDLNKDSRIDVNDLTLFTDFWLERTQITSSEPNSTDKRSY